MSLVLLSGCFTVEQASSPGGGEHILVSNYGWFLFNRYPIVCGNAQKDASLDWSFFRNDVDEKVLLGRLIDVATAKKCDVDELNLSSTEHVLLYVYSIPVPIPYLLCYQELQISGLMRARAADTSQDDPRLREYRRLLDRIPDGGAER